MIIDKKILLFFRKYIPLSKTIQMPCFFTCIEGRYRFVKISYNIIASGVLSVLAGGMFSGGVMVDLTRADFCELL